MIAANAESLMPQTASLKIDKKTQDAGFAMDTNWSLKEQRSYGPQPSPDDSDVLQSVRCWERTDPRIGDQLARHTYVPTKLDSDLAPAILEGRFRLVILTGNAGDGKTAFIQMLEKHASEQGTTVERCDSLGSRFVIAGLQYRTLYDGSVDSEDGSNFDMLSEFFSPLQGDSTPSGDFCLVAAMNEGKLRDFLSHSTKHSWLSRILLNHLRKDEPLPGDMVLVNLNLRSVVDAASELGQCLFDQILDRYVANEFWMACDQCPAREKCPAIDRLMCWFLFFYFAHAKCFCFPAYGFCPSRFTSPSI